MRHHADGQWAIGEIVIESMKIFNFTMISKNKMKKNALLNLNTHQ